MNPSRIGTPLNKQIDEWMFHFNGKAVKFTVHMKRRRDPEAGESGAGALGLATFHAYLDRQYLLDNGMNLKELGFPITPVSGHDYNEVFEKVKHSVWAAKDQAWDKVIAMAVKGIDRRTDADKVKFSWGIGYRSKDGTLYKTADSRNYVSRRPGELLHDSMSFDKDDIKILPYTEELEASLTNMDGMFVQFVGALKGIIANPERLLAATCKLLPIPLTDAEIAAKVDDEKNEGKLKL
jgi:hypothetical protein